jgi:hypothetical protein
VTRKQLRIVQASYAAAPVVNVEAIPDNQRDRTLLWGYTLERDSWHVYLKGGLIHLHHYSSAGTISHRSGHTMVAADLRPDKRAYPEACDFGFCMLMCKLGVDIPFTTIQEREPAQFYGELA